MRSLAGWVMAVAVVTAPAQEQGYQAERRVKGPSRLEWEFAAGPKATLPSSYDSRRQRYQLFVPRTYDATKAWPLVVFVAPGDDPQAWPAWRVPCEEAGALFAAPYGAGNGCPPAERLRLVLDVLDDVRAQYRIDPERTYLAGQGGGGAIASRLATAFPEYVGGMIVIGGEIELPRLAHLRHRLRDRLSVVLIANRADPARRRMEKYFAPLLRDLGVRQKFWLGEAGPHDLPAAKTLAAALRWLEVDLKRRADDARAIALGIDETPSRRKLAARALTYVRSELRNPDRLYAAASALEWVVARCGAAPDAEQAAELLRGLREDEVQGRVLLKLGEAEVRQRLASRGRALESFGDLDAARRAWDGVAVLAEGDEQKNARTEERRLAALLARSPYLGLTFAGNTLTVKEVVRDGPADAAGVQVGDEVERLDKVRVTTSAAVREQLRRLRPGDNLPLSVRREGKPVTFSVRVGAPPKER